MLTEIDTSIGVYCIDPLTISVAEQIAKVRKSSVIVAEHGTSSYSILFADDGAVLLSIGSVSLVKEPQVLLFSSHFQSIFLPIEKYELLKNYVSFAL